MIELEKTYLVKELPKNLLKSKSKEIIDIYVPATVAHPILRIREKGDKFEITKEKDNLIDFILKNISQLGQGDIIAVTSKIVSLSEGRTGKLKDKRKLI